MQNILAGYCRSFFVLILNMRRKVYKFNTLHSQYKEISSGLVDCFDINFTVIPNGAAILSDDEKLTVFSNRIEKNDVNEIHIRDTKFE